MQDIWDKLYEKAMKVLNPRKISDIVEVGGVASAVEAESGNIYVGVCIDCACTRTAGTPAQTSCSPYSPSR